MTTDARYTQRATTAIRRRRPPTSARSRARLILDLDGNHWLVADDHAVERELQALAERITAALLESVKGAA